MIKKHLNYSELADKALAILKKGCFLNTYADGRFNTMTIAWGSIGFMWGDPEFTVMLRKTRFSRELLEKNPYFTISMPYNVNMTKALGICGTLSGRDCDKLVKAGLTTKQAQKVNVPIINGAGLHFECKVVFKQDMDPEMIIDEKVNETWYNIKKDDYYRNFHTIYFGRILDAYIE